MEEEEEEDFGPKTYRTDGYWYRNAFRILGKFVNKLKLDMVMSKRDMPFDVQTLILTISEKDQDKYIPMSEQLRLLREYDTFIKAELRTQLGKLKIPYNESDMYVNVINYANANRLNLSDDNVLLNQVLPWMGMTDWHSNTGGTHKQLVTIKKKIKELKGGRLNMKKSRKLQKRKKISIKNKKIYY